MSIENNQVCFCAEKLQILHKGVYKKQFLRFSVTLIAHAFDKNPTSDVEL